MRDNTWRNGNVKFQLSSLPSILLERSGLKPLSVVLDEQVGAEIVLLVTEPEGQVNDFQGIDAIDFFVKSGLVSTTYGPVFWLLFIFSEPNTNEKITYENVVNPKNLQQMSIYWRLAEQKYWHVVIADEQGKVVNFFEFQNTYGLSDIIQQVQKACAELDVSDFLAAKSEYECEYSVEELLEM